MEYSNIWRRGAAYFIDIVILFILFMIVSGINILLPVFFSFIILILVWIVMICYFFYMEAVYGQTLGKMLMKIKVVNEEGETPEFWSIFVRNILRVIDIIPAFYIIGIILILATKEKQRLGDIAAKTFVIRA